MEEKVKEIQSAVAEPEQIKQDEISSESSEEKDDRKMHKAVCSDCGKDCEVPFEPEEGKPVRCQDCYRKNRPPRRGGFTRFQKRMYDTQCAECKKDCQVPFKPNGKKPVLCRDCFEKSKN